MGQPHFNLSTMHGYNAGDLRKGYNPFDNPEDWEFFMQPFAFEEGEDILEDYTFQIKKLTRRLHTWFDPISNRQRLESGYYLSLIDAATEAEDYIVGALKYARLCRMEKTLYLIGSRDLKEFFDIYSPAFDALCQKLKEMARSKLIGQNLEELDGLGDYIGFHSWQKMVQQAPGGKELCKFFLNPEINALFAKAEFHQEGLFKYDRHGFIDTSCYEYLMSKLDMMLFDIRGTLLLTAFQKIFAVGQNLAMFAERHDKLKDKLCANTYDELLAKYARSKRYRQFRDELLPKRCASELALLSQKPTMEQVNAYFNNQFRQYVYAHNDIQIIFMKNNENKAKVGLELINAIADEERRSEVDDFLFLRAYSDELTNQKRSAIRPKLPEALDTPEAKMLLKKARKAGFIDEQWQPAGDFRNDRKASVLAYIIGMDLNLDPLWTPFETLWNKPNLRQSHAGASSTKYYNELVDKIKKILR